jgi:hypothetical protein
MIDQLHCRPVQHSFIWIDSIFLVPSGVSGVFVFVFLFFPPLFVSPLLPEGSIRGKGSLAVPCISPFPLLCMFTYRIRPTPEIDVGIQNYFFSWRFKCPSFIVISDSIHQLRLGSFVFPFRDLCAALYELRSDLHRARSSPRSQGSYVALSRSISRVVAGIKQSLGYRMSVLAVPLAKSACSCAFCFKWRIPGC